MPRPSRGHCWSVPVSADSACNIGRPKHPTPSWGGRCSNPGENSGPDSDIRGRPGKLAPPPAIRERGVHQGWLRHSAAVNRTAKEGEPNGRNDGAGGLVGAPPRSWRRQVRRRATWATLLGEAEAADGEPADAG